MSRTAERLRDLQGDYRLAVCLEAADELDRLTALNAEMLEALKALHKRHLAVAWATRDCKEIRLAEDAIAKAQGRA